MSELHTKDVGIFVADIHGFAGQIEQGRTFGVLTACWGLKGDIKFAEEMQNQAMIAMTETRAGIEAALRATQ